ncbi:MAG: glucan biosynthesis protein [Deltaproteobacteria bacterium]|nr:glucan biosynthesis protein [Deltaproteobacteria bacterium]
MFLPGKYIASPFRRSSGLLWLVSALVLLSWMLAAWPVWAADPPPPSNPRAQSPDGSLAPETAPPGPGASSEAGGSAAVAESVPEEGGASPNPPSTFNFEQVERLARALATQPFVPQDPKKVNFARENIGENVWRAIQFKEDGLLWADEGFFAVGFCHPGSVYDQTVAISVVEGGVVNQIPFRASLFSYPNPALPLKINEAGLGFSGFSLYFPVNNQDLKEKALVFQGASNFQALARQADLGLTSRGLIIDPALPEGEQYPYFRRFWLVKPQPGEREMTIYALLDAPSLTGAFAFVIKPGTSTVIEVSVVLFSRQEQWPRKLGLAPVSGMYLFSEKENGSPYDWRPEVHSADALLYSSDNLAWFHRPLNNPRRLLSTFFLDSALSGYGLIQKDNSFDHYQDIGARYERRAWVFVEPGEGFGSGRLELLEIPSSKEIHENVQAFWVRDMSSQNASRELRYDYKLYWTTPGVTPHQLGRVVANRILTNPDPETAEFIVDFESQALNALSGELGLASLVEPEGDFPVLEKRLFKNPVTGGWRLRFKVRSPLTGGMVNAIFNGRDDNWRSPRIRARLVRGENLPEPITETFIYDFHQ